MRYWFLQQMDKLGLDTSNLKTKAELNYRILAPGASEKIIFPKELDTTHDWSIKDWFFEQDQFIKPGDVIGAAESKTQRYEFTSYVGGKLNYFKQIGEKIEGGQLLAEITGSKNTKQ